VKTCVVKWGTPLVALLLFAGCGDLLDVEDPDIIDPGSSQSPEGANAARVGALAALNVATTGTAVTGGESFFLFGGLLADEWRSSDTFTQRDETDKRSVQTSNALIDQAVRDLHRARFAAQRAGALLEEFAPTPAWRLGQMYWAQGYTEILLAEHFCSAAFTDVEGDEILYGPPVHDTTVAQRALAHFDSAALNVGGEAGGLITNLARLGRARALLWLGRHAEAGAAVASVPTSFVALNEHSQTSHENQFWSFNIAARRYTLVNRDGTNGIDFLNSNDPRLPYCRGGDARCSQLSPPATDTRGFDSQTALSVQLIWPNAESEAPLASGIEARLIEAEAALRAGNDAVWLAELNELRTTGLFTVSIDPQTGVPDTTWSAGTGGVADLRPLVMPATAAERENLMFRERAFWLFSTGHRLGDLRRLVRQYGRTVNSTFPVGSFHKGGTYGTDTNFPLPQSEDNNPNVTAARAAGTINARGCFPNTI
jgi:starch-binding outer membrane protein, SusD/RagB family